LMISVVGALLTVIITVAYLRSFGDHGNQEHGRAMAIITLIVSSCMLTAVLSRLRTRMSIIIIALALGISLLLVQVPTLGALLHLSPLHLDDWAIAIGSSVVVAALPLFGTLVRNHRQ